MSHRRLLPRSRLALGLAVALAAAPAFAQQTSSALQGIVVGNDGAPIANAEVIITHTASGTVSRTRTDENGRYSARGLRVGGPYTVVVTADGYQSKSTENLFLQLGQVGNASLFLEPATQQLEQIEVVASAQSSIFSPDAMGAGTTIGEGVIRQLPSIRRDLQDYARLDPRISQTDKERSEISALGQNSRFNSITIDSVTTNDTFGLEANNLPTLRQPISLDAIEEVQINVVNYGVEQRGYTGANINAVTRSGTNEFKGSVYGTYRDGDWVRKTDDRGVEFNGFDQEETYGFTFGGPLLKDRLFFFLNYDKTKISAPGPDLGSGPLDRATDGISSAQLAEVIGIAQGFGFQPGDLNPGGLDTEVETWLARFDWNISDYHRASLRVSTTDQSEAILPGFGTNFLSLSSYWYSQEKEFDNYVFQLFSDWSESFSTELRVGYRDYLSAPSVFARQPQVQVDFGRANVRFGTEQFRHANRLETQTLNAYFAGNLFLGAHDVKFGADFESNDVFNLFLESSLGRYRFASLDAFRNGGPLREYSFRTSTTGNVNDAAADFTLDNIGLFVQDVWSVNYNLTLNFGLRLDIPQIDEKPPFNQAFFDAFGIRNDGTIDGNELLQPRFGFNYTFDAERPTQLRGGVGLFQGAAANVWLANPFTNNGLTIVAYGCGTGGFASCPSTGGPVFSADPDNQPLFAAGSGPRADVDVVQSDLEQPSVWKANLALDHELPWWGATASAEVIFTEVESGIYYEHLNLGQVLATGPDGRNFYWGSTDPSRYNASQNRFNGGARNGNVAGFNDVLLTRRTGKGDGQQLTLSINKPYSEDSDISWSLSYAYTDADEVSGLTSSRAISNWRSVASLNPGSDVASRSAYVNKDRIIGTFSVRHTFFDGYKTEFAAFYEGRRGKPYSWVFNNDANGDNQAGNDLLYIPSGPGDVIFTDPSEEAAFWDIVNRNGLAGYAGRVVPRNSHFSPWVNSVDIRVSQELPGFFEGHSSEIWIDVLNVGNLINKDWGHIDEIFFQSDGGQARSFVNFAGIDPASGRYVYDLVNLEDFGRRDRQAESRWALQIGFRYRF
ncbi:MAG: Oar protein [Lysobacteraceae bacterium]|nr:MAG: Oar protein [Xanthomonadaceae bacterium]